MDEEQKKQVAVFRFGVISDFVSPTRLDWGERTRLLREKSERQWQIPFSNRTRLSQATILSWLRAYESGGRRLEPLYPQSRSDRGLPRVLDEETALALIGLRREMPKATVRSLIRTARERGLVDPEQYLAESTVWRLLKREGLMKRQAAPVDRRRYEAELPNDIWQSDVMHGPLVSVEGKKRKAYLIAFLDDMSRLICHAQFYSSEKLDAYLDALRQALLTRGLPGLSSAGDKTGYAQLRIMRSLREETAPMLNRTQPELSIIGCSFKRTPAKPADQHRVSSEGVCGGWDRS